MFLILFCIFLCLAAFLVYHVILYRNPYKLFMVFGKKGSGKSTLMCKLALKYAKRGRPVYCNTPIPGTYYFDVDKIGFEGFPEDSVILIDEVGMIWDNRNFKTFKPEVRDYFKLQRHYKHTVYLFSQTFDVDKKLRDLTDNMYLIRNFFNCFTIARRITKTITIVHAGQGQDQLLPAGLGHPVHPGAESPLEFVFDLCQHRSVKRHLCRSLLVSQLVYHEMKKRPFLPADRRGLPPVGLPKAVTPLRRRSRPARRRRCPAETPPPGRRRKAARPAAPAPPVRWHSGYRRRG